MRDPVSNNEWLPLKTSNQEKHGVETTILIRHLTVGSGGVSPETLGCGYEVSADQPLQMPCITIDFEKISNVLKDFKYDYQHSVTRDASVENIKGFSDTENALEISHGYGPTMRIDTRHVYLQNDDCLSVTWAEKDLADPASSRRHGVRTAPLSVGTEGISTAALSEYLDSYLDEPGIFDQWVDAYWGGTPFLSEMLKIAYRFYRETGSKAVREALKLTLAYNLTTSRTFVENVPDEMGLRGKVEDETSQFVGKTMAPALIDFQIKCAMADLWREFDKEVRENLQTLSSRVYSCGERKHRLTIFLVAFNLTGIWESMVFDCYYHDPDSTAVEKFCYDMETTAVGVIVGYFQAISQGLLSFLEWDTSKHHVLLGSNTVESNTITQIHAIVYRYQDYLDGRPDAKFDRKDFDSLSSKFLSQIVIHTSQGTTKPSVEVFHTTSEGQPQCTWL